ncbi:hypothetical protein K488DRAFT_74522 [Vararia minispora EC-137]|uniref:Uncharacterized protein n=1 Tax=Vararia minispora EC-137 TaxID=1314806 RepID=A0ACB8Q8D8_9AGAM|nr:hypothetical protein K488DRAFT_74522 [Vararia minispora EC-137]
MNVLVIGASGRIGSAAVESCLDKGHNVTAFLRTPGKLPSHLRRHGNLRIVQGDASIHADISAAMQGQDAVIQAAVYGSNTPWGDTSAAVAVVRTVIDAAREASATRATPVRLWVLSGQVLMDIPALGTIEGNIIPVHPEHHLNYSTLRERGDSVDWSLLCPGKVWEGGPRGPLVHAVDVVPIWHAPGLIGSLPSIGPLLNVLYNFAVQRLSYRSVGDFLATHLGPAGEMWHKRVCILEDVGRRAE